MTVRHLAAGVLLVLVVLAGCSTPLTPDRSQSGTDTLGVVEGYRYDQSLAVDGRDGLNATEQRAVIGRAMARIEVLRELEFTQTVDVRVISRAEYRSQQSASNQTHVRWNNQVWEGLFIVGEDRSINDVFNQTLGSAVLGYYAPEPDEIVLVSDNETPAIDRGTLVHELVHALQDQQFGLEGGAKTQDRQLARSGLLEGEANSIEERYQDRCQGEWDCVNLSAAGGSGGTIDRGVYMVLLMPYITGPPFVEHVRAMGGWDAVNSAYETSPASAAQIIHPERYPDDRPLTVSIPDRSATNWHRFEHDPVADTVGQASIHAMFVTNDVWSEGVDPYEYRHPAAEGWAGDALVPYHAGDAAGYVWETAWETPTDAAEFYDAYLDLLDRHGATLREAGVYVVPESDAFGDAFRVIRDGRRVRIVNAPTVAALSKVHAS